MSNIVIKEYSGSTYEELLPKPSISAASQISYSNTTTGISSNNVQGAIDNLFTSVSNRKQLLASAITDKRVSTSKDDSFQTMASNINNISIDIGNYCWEYRMYNLTKGEAAQASFTYDSTQAVYLITDYWFNVTSLSKANSIPIKCEYTQVETWGTLLLNYSKYIGKIIGVGLPNYYDLLNTTTNSFQACFLTSVTQSASNSRRYTLSRNLIFTLETKLKVTTNPYTYQQKYWYPEELYQDVKKRNWYYFVQSI